jgi:hypothetical protein
MALPWARLAQLVPMVLGLSRELLDLQSKPRVDALRGAEARLAALEEGHRRQAEIVHSLAQQAAALAEAAASLRRWAIGAAIGAAVALAAAIAALVAAVS